ncbi:MAG: TlyA family RNA methyltransferase, partial [Coriobacteriales bacterium]|nr:TlyA family RNA methyltransferase [Coriobacteriales bacterium]
MNSGNKTRLTELLVARGLAADVGAAERAVLAGEVVLIEEGRPEPLPLTQARMLLDSSCELRLKERRRYVSRGGDKLAGALADFQFDPRGLCCLDVGASTGGFTDCLLQQGAASVLAVDVAYGQLAWPLRVDARVTVLERTNIRSLDAGILGRTFDLAVADVSFTPIRSLLASLASLLVPGGTLIALIKPPFELPEKDVGAKGIVSDPRAHAK